MTSTTVPQEAVKAMPERIYAAKKTEGSNCVVSFDTPSLDYNVEYVRADLALPHLPQGEPSAARELALEEEEFAIDKLRFRAFHTNSDADRQAYFDAVSKWFQDRHTRRMDAESERLRFEGDLDKWMKIIGAGITGYQPEAYALMDLACDELVKLRAENASLRAALSSPDQADAGNVEGDGIERTEFNRGYVLACANIVNLHGADVAVMEGFAQLGISKAELKALDLCDYDQRAIDALEDYFGADKLYRTSAPSEGAE